MSIFDVLKSLLFTKKVDDRGELCQSFNCFMINRWLSFYDKTQALFVNEIFNRYHTIFDNKDEAFDLYFNLIPKQKYKKIEYAKKSEKSNAKDNDIVEAVARSREISQREVRQYMDIFCK